MRWPVGHAYFGDLGDAGQVVARKILRVGHGQGFEGFVAAEFAQTGEIVAGVVAELNVAGEHISEFGFGRA